MSCARPPKDQFYDLQLLRSSSEKRCWFVRRKVALKGVNFKFLIKQWENHLEMNRKAGNLNRNGCLKRQEVKYCRHKGRKGEANHMHGVNQKTKYLSKRRGFYNHNEFWAGFTCILNAAQGEAIWNIFAIAKTSIVAISSFWNQEFDFLKGFLSSKSERK